MKKSLFTGYVSLLIIMSFVLSSCQLFTGYQQIEKADSADRWSGKIYPVAGETNIACVGTYHCEIIRIDKTAVISVDTHQPVDNAIVIKMPNSSDTPLLDGQSVKLVPLSASAMAGITSRRLSSKSSGNSMAVKRALIAVVSVWCFVPSQRAWPPSACSRSTGVSGVSQDSSGQRCICSHGWRISRHTSARSIPKKRASEEMGGICLRDFYGVVAIFGSMP